MTTRPPQSIELVRERVRSRLLAALLSVAPADFDAILAEAKADRPRTLRAVDRYLVANPSGLVTPDSTCPLGIVRLTLVLSRRGHTVVPLACAGCGRRLLLPTPMTEAGSASGVTAQLI